MPRFRIRVFHADNSYTQFQLWFNGDLITNDYLQVRNSDFVYVIHKLDPEVISVDRENITYDLWKRIKDLPAIELL